MLFHSTRGKDSNKTFEQILMQGLAQDGGLYMPDYWPQVNINDLKELDSFIDVAKKIVQRAADFGIPSSDIVVDPLVMPIGAMATAGQQVFRLVRRLREELKVNTTCGASNISFGLPNRHAINASFLPMAIASGMSSAIMNPTNTNEMDSILAANLLMNRDPNGARWIKRNRIAEQINNPASSNGNQRGAERRRRRKPR